VTGGQQIASSLQRTDKKCYLLSATYEKRIRASGLGKERVAKRAAARQRPAAGAGFELQELGISEVRSRISTTQAISIS